MTAGQPPTDSGHNWLLDLMQGLGGWVWEATADSGSIVFISDRAQSLLGYPPERLLDKPSMWLDIVHPADRARLFDIVEQGRRTGEAGIFDGRVRCADGAWIWLRSFMRVVRDEDGERGKIYGVSFDIAELKRVETELEEARRRAAFLAEASRILASSLDYETTLKNVARVAVPAIADWCATRLLAPDGALRETAVVHVDPAKETLVRRIARETAPRTADAHGPGKVLMTGAPEFIREIDERQLAQWARDPRHLELVREIGLESYICVPMAARGHVLGTIALMISGSGRRYTEADLALAQDLAARGAMAIDNARFYQNARDEVARREAFLAVLGHELRNPLGAISNAVKALEVMDSHDPRASVQRDILTRQTGQLSRLVDDLLDVSRMLSGKIRLERRRVALGEVAERCLQAFCGSEEAAQRNISLSIPSPDLAVEADEVRLEQIIFNLLSNAVKFTAPGGNISLAVVEEGSHAVIRVKDNGVGIRPDQLPYIFDAFRQGTDDRPDAGGGLGIGLALVRSLAELHGGSAQAASSGLGGGSEFTVKLSLSHNAAAAKPGHGAKAPIAARRILIVDDDHDSLESLQALLEVMGHQVESATDGPGALEKIGQGAPEVALIDIGLPGYDGHELCRRVRAMDPKPRPTLIALTGYGQPEDRRRALEAGFDAHLTKPIDLDRLRELLAAGPAQAERVRSAPQ
jgi:PAS domain S-box-containing protein